MTAPLDDSEAVRLCAEAMGYRTEIASDGTLLTWSNWRGGWNPLTDDAQALALVKRFDMVIERDGETLFGVTLFGEGGYAKGNPTFVVRDESDLNRAIVFCVAQAQRAKAT